MTIRALLWSEGIRTNADLWAWCDRRSRSESRYAVLIREFGEVNADRIMRLAEVADWSWGPHEQSANSN
jgi:hypothetical protein